MTYFTPEAITAEINDLLDSAKPMDFLDFIDNANLEDRAHLQGLINIAKNGRRVNSHADIGKFVCELADKWFEPIAISRLQKRG